MAAPTVLATTSQIGSTTTDTSITLGALPGAASTSPASDLLVLSCASGGNAANSMSISGDVAGSFDSLLLPLPDVWYRVYNGGLSTMRHTVWLARPAVGSSTLTAPTVTSTTGGRMVLVCQRIGPVMAGTRPLVRGLNFANSPAVTGPYVPADTLVLEHVATNNDTAAQVLDSRITQVSSTVQTPANSGGLKVLTGRLTTTPTAGTAVADFLGTFGTSSNWSSVVMAVKGPTSAPDWPLTLPVDGFTSRVRRSPTKQWDGTRWADVNGSSVVL